MRGDSAAGRTPAWPAVDGTASHLIHRPRSWDHYLLDAPSSGEEEFVLVTQTPLGHPLFNDGPDHFHDVQGAAELARQVGEFIGHRYFGLPGERRAVFARLGLSVTDVAGWRAGPGRSDLTVQLRARPTDVLRGVPRGVALHSELAIDGVSCATGTASLAFLPPDSPLHHPGQGAAPPRRVAERPDRSGPTRAPLPNGPTNPAGPTGPTTSTGLPSLPNFPSTADVSHTTGIAAVPGTTATAHAAITDGAGGRCDAAGGRGGPGDGHGGGGGEDDLGPLAPQRPAEAAEVGRGSPANVVVSEPTESTYGRFVTQLLASTYHRVFAAEGGAHLSGMLLLEAMRQTALLAAGRTYGLAPSRTTVASSRVLFRARAEPQLTVVCAAVPGRLGRDAGQRPSVPITVTLTQHGRRVAEATATVVQDF